MQNGPKWFCINRCQTNNQRHADFTHGDVLFLSMKEKSFLQSFDNCKNDLYYLLGGGTGTSYLNHPYCIKVKEFSINVFLDEKLLESDHKIKGTFLR